MHASEQPRVVRKGCPPMAVILLAVTVSLLAVMVQVTAGLPEALQWQRGSISALSWATSHLCHWSWDHLIWDLGAFALLSWLSLRLAPSRYALCLILAAALIPLEVRINQPMLETYRGLSGIDTALLGLLIAVLWRKSSPDQNGHASRWLAAISACGFVAKTTYELTTGGTVFVEAGAQPFVPVPSAHLVGFLAGLTAGFLKLSFIAPAAPAHGARLSCT